MKPTERIQTVIRLRPEIMARARRKAREEGRSFNSYVESLIDRHTALDFPVLPEDYSPSAAILNMAGCIVEPSKEALAADPKLAYLWEKYGKD